MTANIIGLDELLREFRDAPRALQRETKAVIKRTAVEIKRDAIQRVRAGTSAGRSYLPHYPKSITFDLEDSGMTAIIGPDSSMLQGGMGRGVEFGSARTAPIPHMLPAADKQDEPMRRYLLAALRKAL